VAGRRGSGEGSVYYITGRRLWAAAVSLPGGGRKVVKAKTKVEALRKMRENPGRRRPGPAGPRQFGDDR
jgi:hypothetical protein